MSVYTYNKIQWKSKKNCYGKKLQLSNNQFDHNYKEHFIFTFSEHFLYYYQTSYHILTIIKDFGGGDSYYPLRTPMQTNKQIEMFTWFLKSLREKLPF